MASKHLSRREFLIASAITASGAVLAACGPTPTATPLPTATKVPATNTPVPPAATAVPPTATKPAVTNTPVPPTAVPPTATPAAPATKFKEAPMLTDLVKAGKLPNVDQRLPDSPLVVKPVEKVGKYGGTWRCGVKGARDAGFFLRYPSYETIVRWDPEFNAVIPGVAESFSINTNATEFTFKMRKGLKWSDGSPFTAEDVKFFYDMYIMDKDLYKEVDSDFVSGDKPVVATKVDDLTIKFTYEVPHGLFMRYLAHPGNWRVAGWCKNYLKQFHKTLNPTGIDALVKAAGVADWKALWTAKAHDDMAQFEDPNYPVLHAWKVSEQASAATTLWQASRNPYFWKVDSEGNQLPYIDKMTARIVQDVQTLVVMVATGELDMQDRYINDAANKPVFADNMTRGSYHFFETVPTQMNTMMISLNMTSTDANKRKIFSNKDFRIGLSYAINRPEMIKLIWAGQGIPYQGAPRPESVYYNKTLATQYSEFDVAKANAALDKAGFDKKDSAGIRLGPDGKKISFTIECANQNRWPDALQLVIGYWKAVGVEAALKVQETNLMYERWRGNLHDCTVWTGDGGSGDLPQEMRYYFPYNSAAQYAVPWASWWVKTDPYPKEEPPEIVKKQMTLYDTFKVTGDLKKQDDLINQIIAIAVDQFYAIGTALPGNSFGIQKNTMFNVPKTMVNSWVYPQPGPTNPCQYFFG